MTTPKEHDLLLNATDLIFDCGKQFRMYEELHKQKQTADGLQKAQTNAVFANKCEEFNKGVREWIKTKPV